MPIAQGRARLTLTRGLTFFAWESPICIDTTTEIPAMNIGEAARRADLPPTTIRHDEDISLIAQLQMMRDTSSELVRSCAGNSRPDCPILRDLAAQVSREGGAPTGQDLPSCWPKSDPESLASGQTHRRP